MDFLWIIGLVRRTVVKELVLNWLLWRHWRNQTFSCVLEHTARNQLFAQCIDHVGVVWDLLRDIALVYAFLLPVSLLKKLTGQLAICFMLRESLELGRNKWVWQTLTERVSTRAERALDHFVFSQVFGRHYVHQRPHIIWIWWLVLHLRLFFVLSLVIVTFRARISADDFSG